MILICGSLLTSSPHPLFFPKQTSLVFDEQACACHRAFAPVLPLPEMHDVGMLWSRKLGIRADEFGPFLIHGMVLLLSSEHESVSDSLDSQRVVEHLLCARAW